jgi:hypothetical protein
MGIWYILWTFDIFRGNLVYFSHLGILYQEKSGNLGWSWPRKLEFLADLNLIIISHWNSLIID